MTHYTFTIQACIDDVTAPLQIHAESVNEVRRAVRLLRENGLVSLPEKLPEAIPTKANIPQQIAGSPPKATHITRCRSCGTAITFVATQNGKKMPMDVNSDGTLGASHFTSCPDATKFRRGAA